MDDPAFIRWLAKRNEQVSAELQKGEYATLEELQEKWARKKKRPNSKYLSMMR
jgi:hypothetical protein